MAEEEPPTQSPTQPAATQTPTPGGASPPPATAGAGEMKVFTGSTSSTNSDPFAGIRSKCLHDEPDAVEVVVIDHLDQNSRFHLQRAIRELYDDNCAGDAKIPANRELADLWSRTLANALCVNRPFQTVCISAWLAGGKYGPFPGLTMKRDWALCFYLKGFYHKYGDWHRGYMQLREQGKTIINMAKDRIFKKLGELESLMEGHRVSAAKSGLALALEKLASGKSRKLGGTNEYLATLFQLIQSERRKNHLEFTLFNALEAIEPLINEEKSGLESAGELLASYRRNNSVENHTLTDRFGKRALRLIKKAQPKFAIKPLPALTPEEIELIHEGAATVYDVELDNKDDEEAGSSVNAPGQIEWVSFFPDADTGMFYEESELPPHYECIANYFQSYQDDTEEWPIPITYPNCILPQEACTVGPAEAVTQSQAEAIVNFQSARKMKQDFRLKMPMEDLPTEVIGNQNATKVFRRSASFVAGRQLSEKEAQDLAPDVEKVLEESKWHTEQSIDNIDENMWQFLCGEFGAIVARPTGAEKPAKTEDGIKYEFRQYSDWLLQDNIFHVRKLLLGILAVMRANESIRDVIADMEEDLLLLFAAIRRPAESPLPWLLAVDYLLREFWRGLILTQGSGDEVASDSKFKGIPIEKQKQLTDEDWVKVRKLCDELSLWAQGCCIIAMALRHPEVSPYARPPLDMWYRHLIQFDARCGNPQCQRLLPDADRVEGLKLARGTFSVGTREARIGKRSVRMFISANRDFAFNCNFDMIAYREPHADLVITVYHYSRLFHSAACKAQNGKYYINSF